MGNFSDRVAIVTGGGSGIGRAVCLQLASEGAHVVVADVKEDRANAVAAEIAASGASASAAVGDLSDAEVVERVVAETMSTHGRIDVLVANAGIMDDMSGPEEVSVELWERVMRVNLTAPFLLTRAVAPHMLAAERGSIVYTASEAGMRGSAAGTAYTVSKHGLIGLMRSGAVLYRNRGVRVNAVAPGGTKTNLEVNMNLESEGLKAIGAYAGNVGRIAEASEVAAAIVFLASDAASNISGALLASDGGWVAV
jgi:NAD(P)-dependent dehydrogenase (short-subunit alcohol dehydrogenase family)